MPRPDKLDSIEFSRSINQLTNASAQLNELSNIPYVYSASGNIGLDYRKITLDSSAGAFTLTLPKSNFFGFGNILQIEKTSSDTNIVTIDGNGTETINGQLSKTIQYQYDYLWIRSDGTNWEIINEVSVAGGGSVNSVTDDGNGVVTVEIQIQQIQL